MVEEFIIYYGIPAPISAMISKCHDIARTAFAPRQARGCGLHQLIKTHS